MVVNSIEWKVKDTVARMDMVLKIDAISPNGDIFVKVGIWDDDAEKFLYQTPQRMGCTGLCFR